MLSAYARKFPWRSIRTLSHVLLNQRREVLARGSTSAHNVNLRSSDVCSGKMWSSFNGARCFSAKSMRSKVEKRMQRESGKTLREIRRAKKLRKKLMTDEERLIYNLRRAKKKVALLLQKLKKYELPELPSPRHDPELFTPEQLQAYKKIGFKNKNYVPVGVRGVFGGVVQNMHLHWKFHETVQVCCDNFPKEKIKEMASMLTRLSGGIVVNIHNGKTIIMFRGRNYRQPKNLIPINTLTKRKALFKARFEQALDSQKLNIKKTEQELRRKGVNPDDPVAMASIQRVASTFFNAIDKREGSPYVFREDRTKTTKPPKPEESSQRDQEAGEVDEDSDQEELDRFIAEIEDAADKEWVMEEEAEKEDLHRIRYWNREDFGLRFVRPEMNRFEGSDDESIGRKRNWEDEDEDEVGDADVDFSEMDDNEWDSDDDNKKNTFRSNNKGNYKNLRVRAGSNYRREKSNRRSDEELFDLSFIPIYRLHGKVRSSAASVENDLATDGDRTLERRCYWTSKDQGSVQRRRPAGSDAFLIASHRITATTN
ncbi:RNA-binding CRS1 / YhbY (CRM) domain protein [Striga hermonthica]|uniref:RNA-binding CRS1 / YhbY (CRM) domain protein n=1 Tax=Striga hermonthica TaxID=68872 RepID=A0A9N7MUY3_STRHE|nr:RNA-binding CRS1 / YhbY (CRM) domain protein [Striga hermonthica]